MPGYFADDAMAVRVMGSRAVGLTYGQRALVIGAAHPRLFVGTVENTAHRDTPYNRLARTARLFEAVFLGTKEEADRALEFTRRRHARVTGVMAEAAGPYAAGTPYSATDPHLMFMTMAFAFDSVDVLQRLLIRPLTPGEQEALYQDFVTWAELFGMPRDAAPPDYPTFRRSFDGWLASGEPHLTEHARVVGSYLVGAKRGDYDDPLPLRPLFRSIDLVVRGSLPASIRRLYGFRWTPVHEAAYRTALQTVRVAHVEPPHFVPRPLDPVLHGVNAPLFKILAGRERQQLRRGRRSMPEAAAMLDRSGTVQRPSA
ncbi:MAG: oxygenase MpaB family protein [Jatrophihabitans sp.]|uniref:oxygenase MpaB family protein n=1 Tax=Jatrophihabitans sp. TaxID=1932789 RepID=UPI003F8172A2